MAPTDRGTWIANSLSSQDKTYSTTVSCEPEIKPASFLDKEELKKKSHKLKYSSFVKVPGSYKGR